MAIALREWRAWGMPVNDAPPGPDMPVSMRPDRQAGMWQRVGDYWWFGQNALSNDSGWTGKYGDFGAPYNGEPPAWSAAFISYLMRASGAGDRFPYSALHATYINAAAQGNPILQAQPPESYAPQQGDLICLGRRGAERLRFSNLPAPSFYGHCDLVVSADPGMLTVIGGNVSAGVTMKHVPVTASGHAGRAGRPHGGFALPVVRGAEGALRRPDAVSVRAAPAPRRSAAPAPFAPVASEPPEEDAVPVAAPAPRPNRPSPKRPVAKRSVAKRRGPVLRGRY